MWQLHTVWGLWRCAHVMHLCGVRLTQSVQYILCSDNVNILNYTHACTDRDVILLNLSQEFAPFFKHVLASICAIVLLPASMFISSIHRVSSCWFPHGKLPQCYPQTKPWPQGLRNVNPGLWRLGPSFRADNAGHLRKWPNDLKMLSGSSYPTVFLCFQSTGHI